MKITTALKGNSPVDWLNNNSAHPFQQKEWVHRYAGCSWFKSEYLYSLICCYNNNIKGMMNFLYWLRRGRPESILLCEVHLWISWDFKPRGRDTCSRTRKAPEPLAAMSITAHLYTLSRCNVTPAELRRWSEGWRSVTYRYWQLLHNSNCVNVCWSVKQRMRDRWETWKCIS